MKNKNFIIGGIFFTLIVVVLFIFTFFNNSDSTNVNQPDKPKEYCSLEVACKTGFDCLKFEDEEKPLCWEGDPCQKCKSKKCIIMESYPGQVRCE